MSESQIKVVTTNAAGTSEKLVTATTDNDQAVAVYAKLAWTHICSGVLLEEDKASIVTTMKGNLDHETIDQLIRAIATGNVDMWKKFAPN